MIHSGSRGLGYQVCDDALGVMRQRAAQYGIELPDRQLACAPVSSPGGAELPRRHARRGQLRLGQPAAADAPGPRGVRRSFGARPGARAGAWSTTWPTTSPRWRSTRSTAATAPAACIARAPRGPSRRAIPRCPRPYRADRPAGDHPRRHGPGELGAGGRSRAAWSETFGTTCHGAGRVMSRTAAVRAARGRSIADELRARGIVAGPAATRPSPRRSRRRTRTFATSWTSSSGPGSPGSSRASAPSASSRGEQTTCRELPSRRWCYVSASP